MVRMRASKRRRPGVELAQVFVGERVLILRVAAAAADLDVLLGLEKERGAGDAGEFAAQSVDDLVGGDVAGTLADAA